MNLGSRPITLSFDGSDPALRIAQGTLTLAGQTITVNTPNPLANGTYDLIHVAGGVINSSGSFTLAGNTGAGSISVSGGLVRMTITGSSRVRTTTTLSGSETIYYGSAASVQATVSPAVASGTVQFYLDGAPFGSPVALVGGLVALPSVAGLTGIHSISATYSGSGLHAPSGSTAPVTLTINPYPSDGAVTAADEADAFEIQLLNQQTRYPDNYYLEQPTDDAAMGASVANLQANGRFATITYPVNPNSTVIDEGGGWMARLPRVCAMFKAVITPGSAYYLPDNPSLRTTLLPRMVAAATAYTQTPWDITDEWNYVHTYADMNECHALGSICLYARQVTGTATAHRLRRVGR